MSQDATAVFGPALGKGHSRQLTAAEVDEKFRAYLERTEAYNAAIIASGDVPWWSDPERLSRAAEHLGLPAGSDSMTVRRAMWARRYAK